MKQLYDQVSVACSKITTTSYSSSFSIGVSCLAEHLRNPVYSIYGFVRFADEIVDTFHDYDKRSLFEEFKADTWRAIERKISLNPILNSFQHVVHSFGIERELIECFLQSMETDLVESSHTGASYNNYILGSAEVVGLMCLRVFTENDSDLYARLKPAAMKLGSAFQKVNFLRDVKADYEQLGRTYFPGVNFSAFTDEEKISIEEDIDKDFHAAYEGLKLLPASSRFGVYVAFVYYKTLFSKIRSIPSAKILMERVRITDTRKLSLLLTSWCRHRLSLI
ncbi:MAG: squalene/phytoene synthase family protein [Taibaiella sp.]|nr:squalene/phytoene synthase family protein [Taibaiella sp.]